MFKWINNGLQILNEKRTLKSAVQGLLDDSILSVRFVTFSLLAGFMASLGVMMDSVPVLIGAMLIAPLLNPVVSLSVGVGAGSIKLIWHSLLALAVGLLLSMGTALFLPYALGPTEISPELLATLDETLLYALVAFVAGITAVYSWFLQVNKVVPAASIAAALVPPIAILGNLIIQNNGSYVYEAVEVITVNLVGIFFGGFLCFLAMSLASRRPTEKVGKQVDQEVAKNGNK